MDRYAEHDFSHVDIMESSMGSHLDNSLDLSGSSIKSNSSFGIPPPLIECGLNNKLKAANSMNNSNFVSAPGKVSYTFQVVLIDIFSI